MKQINELASKSVIALFVVFLGLCIFSEVSVAQDKTQDKGFIKTAYNAIMNKDYKEAVDNYTKAIAQNATFAPSYYGRGVAYCDLNKNDESIADFRKATGLDPKYHEAFYGLGLSNTKAAKYPVALENFTKAIELSPNNSNYYYARANVYYYTEKYDNALVDYSKAIELDPKNSLAFYGRAVVNKTEHRSSTAIKDFETYLDQSGDKDHLASEVRRLIGEAQEDEKK